MMTTESFFERVNDMIEARVEYESSHPDAGDSYAHLPAEGSFDYGNGPDRLRDYCESNGIDLSGIDIDRLSEDVIFWCRMEPGHAYLAYNGPAFLIDTYPVGEIEMQMESHVIGARTTPWLCDRLNRETDAYWIPQCAGYALAYIAVDSSWHCLCDLDRVQDIVEQHRESI